MQIMKLDNAHQIIHDMMTKDIKDNEDIIQEIRDSQNNENIDWGFHMGTMGVAVSVITALSLLLVCVRCAWLRRNKAGCTPSALDAAEDAASIPAPPTSR
jgi:hypothetical protein